MKNWNKVVAFPRLQSEYLKEMDKQIKDTENGICSIDQNSVYYLSPKLTSQTQRNPSEISQSIKFNQKLDNGCCEVVNIDPKSRQGMKSS